MWHDRLPSWVWQKPRAKPAKGEVAQPLYEQPRRSAARSSFSEAPLALPPLPPDRPRASDASPFDRFRHVDAEYEEIPERSPHFSPAPQERARASDARSFERFRDVEPLDDEIPERPPTFSRADGHVGLGPEGHRSRMREKLLSRGPDALADYELLEMLLFFAFKKGDTKPLAKSLIQQFGSFSRLIATGNDELLAVRGLGEHSVAAIRLVHAAALRLGRAEVLNQPVLNNWEKLMDYLNAVMARERIEQFRILFLDARNRLLADEAQARGTVNHTPVYPREVVKRALELHATALILVHNHPSGDTTPSRDDVEMTRQVQLAASAVDVMLHDHVIVGNGSWLSFRQKGLMD